MKSLAFGLRLSQHNHNIYLTGDLQITQRFLGADWSRALVYESLFHELALDVRKYIDV